MLGILVEGNGPRKVKNGWSSRLLDRRYLNTQTKMFNATIGIKILTGN